MYKKFIYKNLTIQEKNTISDFINKNFNINNLDLLPDTLIIIDYDGDNQTIISCVCLINTKLLSISSERFSFCWSIILTTP